MTFQPTPRQVLAMWRMLFMGERPMAGELAKRLGKRGPFERDQLTKEGLIELTPLSKPRRGSQAEITEKGWGWAQQNLDASISRSNLAAEALEAVLRSLKKFMEARDLALSEIIHPPPMETVSEGQIREAYLKISGGRSGVRVRLSEMRNVMSTVSRSSLDATLLSLQANGKLSLYSLDDPSEIGPEDQQAAIDIAGFKKHIVYMGS